MESNFDKYIQRSACYMNDCPYGYDISCDDCVSRMVAEHYAEHDKQIRTEAVEEAAVLIRQFTREWNMTNHKRISYIASDELISYLRNHMKEQSNAK